MILVHVQAAAPGLHQDWKRLLQTEDTARSQRFQQMHQELTGGCDGAEGGWHKCVHRATMSPLPSPMCDQELD